MSCEARAQDSCKPKSRLARQGSLLFAGYGAAQALSFARNALVAHAISKGDFGVAATIAMMLQVLDTVSDLGADRMIVQADDGCTATFVATSHGLLVARGIFLALLIVSFGPAMADYFAVAEAASAFQLAAMVPLVKGFQHLDWRCAQRRIDNRPHMVLEVLPQAIALSAAVPILALAPDYTSVVWLSVVQAAVLAALSHGIARSRYQIAWDGAILRRQLAFGWPILASALPLLAVYQGDRLIVARQLGMENLASFSVAFMATMVPGLIASKVGYGLLLPMFCDARRDGRFAQVFNGASEAATVFSAGFLSAFCVGGGVALAIVFGGNYAGLGVLVGVLALMWSVRILQAVPGMALMAAGDTQPFLVAGVIRALALPLVAWVASHGHGLVAIAAIGCVFEFASLLYVALRLQRIERGLGSAFARRAAVLVLVAIASASVAYVVAHAGDGVVLVATAATAMCAFAVCGAAMPTLRGLAMAAARGEARVATGRGLA